jgi:hypothetical protein
MVEPPHGRRDKDDASWQPGKFAAWYQRWADPDDAQPTTVLLHHPLDPFVATLDDASDKSLHRAAYAYLQAALQLESIGPRLQADLPPDWLASLEPGTRSPTFGWMPVEWPLADRTTEFSEPFGSFRAGASGSDHMVALFASESIGEQQFRGSGFGLRIVLRLRALQGGAFEASITNLCACLPFGIYRTTKPIAFWRERRNIDSLLTALFSSDRKREIAQVARFGEKTVRLRGVRLGKLPGGGWQVERRGVGLPAAGDASGGVPHAFSVLGDENSAGVLLNRTALVADAAPGSACVFVHDPASRGSGPLPDRRPSRDDQILDPFRPDEKITGVLKGPLRRGQELRVLPCPRFVSGDRLLPPNQALPISLDGKRPGVRSDDAAALQGFRHARELLQRLEAYGLPSQAYFRVAKAEIDVYYRSGISPGPGKDGQTVNARVLPTGWPADVIRPKGKADRPTLQLHLGLASLSRRARAPWQPGGARSPAKAMGIGADARWIWHEFGHVLLMATTGELELRFAHSPGDALAAIVADPESQIDREGSRWRFATFPWVLLPRRHDRSVLRGWSWGGALHAELASVPDALHPRRKGYVSEQILSSTLFRMYRCLGGDTVQARNPRLPNRPERRRASHYATWLLMQALQLLGDARVLPARGPEELALALMEADTARLAPWSVTFPPGSPRPYERVGGCAHKAIRWAFEAQGLYIAPGADGNAPGAAPPVDVFIGSGRLDVDSTPYGDVRYGPGNYQPVSLHWQLEGSSEVPQWQAHREAIQVHANNQVEIQVGNRGQMKAKGVEVTVWWKEWPPNSPPLDWRSGMGWTHCPPVLPATQDIPPGSVATFGPFAHTPPAGRYVVFAQAQCIDDRANTDPATGLACSVAATPIMDLVANDNNLGLRVVNA